MIDFTNLPTRKKTYAGANGNKISVVYNGELYMLKFPSHATKNPNLHYANSCITEYLGSHIFGLLGIMAQETLLGTYTVDGTERVVVACKDFASPGRILQDFASLKNSVIDSRHNGYGTELSEIIEAIHTQNHVDPNVLLEHFWNMFIVDALIGNWDRHNGNWGFLYDEQTDQTEIAPVYDCGSCLFPQMDRELMKKVLHDPNEQNSRVYAIPTSSIMIKGKRIRYFDFLSSAKDPDCNAALKRIVPRIKMGKIDALIEQTPFIDRIDKDFYKRILSERYERILQYSLDQVLSLENQQQKKQRTR